MRQGFINPHVLRTAQTRESALAALKKELAMRDKQLAAKDALITQLTQQQARSALHPTLLRTRLVASSQRITFTLASFPTVWWLSELLSRTIVLLLGAVCPCHVARTGHHLWLYRGRQVLNFTSDVVQAAAASGQLVDPTRTSATGAFFRSMLRRGVSGALGATDAGSGVCMIELHLRQGMVALCCFGLRIINSAVAASSAVRRLPILRPVVPVLTNCCVATYALNVAGALTMAVAQPRS